MSENLKRCSARPRRVPPRADARENFGHPDQGPHQPARPVARLLAGGPTPVSPFADDPLEAAALPARNLVAVVSNGTAVLDRPNRSARRETGHGGQGCLFKKFANIDVFDIELSETDPDKIVEIVALSNRPSAGSTWRTSRRPSASRSSASSGTA